MLNSETWDTYDVNITTQVQISQRETEVQTQVAQKKIGDNTLSRVDVESKTQFQIGLHSNPLPTKSLTNGCQKLLPHPSPRPLNRLIKYKSINSHHQKQPSSSAPKPPFLLRQSTKVMHHLSHTIIEKWCITFVEYFIFDSGSIPLYRPFGRPLSSLGTVCGRSSSCCGWILGTAWSEYRRCSHWLAAIAGRSRSGALVSLCCCWRRGGEEMK